MPAAVLGFLFEDYIDEYLFSVKTVAIGLIAGAILMLFADWVNKRKTATDTLDRISYKQAIAVGLFNVLPFGRVSRVQVQPFPAVLF